MKACGILRVSFGFYTGLKFGLKYFQILRGALYIAVYTVIIRVLQVFYGRFRALWVDGFTPTERSAVGRLRVPARWI